MALDLSALTAYVQEQRVPLIHEAMLKAKSADLFSWQPDIKTSAKLNLLNTNVHFSDGTVCGFDDSGSQALSQRELKTGVIKVDMKWCQREMIKYWMQYKVRANANPGALAFEEDFVNGVLGDIEQKLEKAIWQGDVSSSDANLNKFDGMLTILAGETTATASWSTSSMYDTVKNTYEAIPQAAFDRGDVAIFIGEDAYRSYVQELVEKNLFHYDPQQAADMEYFVPGTNTKIYAVAGLNGTSKAVAGSRRNLFYGFDEEGSEQEFKFWYSDDNDEYRMKVVFNAGVQVAFPNEVVVTQ